MSKEKSIVSLMQKLPKASEKRLIYLEGVLDTYLLFDEGYKFKDFPSQIEKHQNETIKTAAVN